MFDLAKKFYQCWSQVKRNSQRLDIQEIQDQQKQLKATPKKTILQKWIVLAISYSIQPGFSTEPTQSEGGISRWGKHKVKGGSRFVLSGGGVGGICCTVSLQPSSRQSGGRSVRRWQHCESKHINWDAAPSAKKISFEICI